MKKSTKITAYVIGSLLTALVMSLCMSLIMYKLSAPFWNTGVWLKTWGKAYPISLIFSMVLSLSIPRLVRYVFQKGVQAKMNKQSDSEREIITKNQNASAKIEHNA